MKNITSKIIILILSISFFYNLKTNAQDNHFSQFRETPMAINPGMTALNKDLRIVLNYKDQWRSFVSPYKTFALSAELNTAKKKSKDNYIGLGIQLISDKAGDSQMGNNLGALNLSGVVRLSDRNKLGMGIMGGYGQRTVNYAALQWESQYVGTAFDATAPSGETAGVTSYTYPDLGAGIAWAYGKDQQYISANNGVHAMFGISAFHFGLPKYSFYGENGEKLNTKYTAQGTVEFGIKNTNLLIAPESLYVRQGTQQEVIVGSVFKYLFQEGSKYTAIKKNSALSLGIDYRLQDALIASLLYEYSNYAVGVSYDVNMSGLKTASSYKGGLEIVLRFVTPNPFNNKNQASFK
jgi:type IX secretion system PorP/SprF family membrane protein